MHYPYFQLINSVTQLTMQNPITIEACVDSIESCMAAEAGGAARVELCSSLFEGGLTPSAGCLRIARQYISIGIQVMIRPRGGDFCYSEAEFESMMYDLQLAKELGADGIVFGILLPDGTIDAGRTRQLAEMARPLNVTFHRAFDMTPDPVQALTVLMDLGIDRLLTSGQETTALEGAPLIARLVDIAQDRIRIMPGGGIHERNIARIIRETGVSEIHVSARRRVPSPMTFQNPGVFMGGVLRQPEYERQLTDSDRIARLINLAQG
jgi:copper homeostasis protein